MTLILPVPTSATQFSADGVQARRLDAPYALEEWVADHSEDGYEVVSQETLPDGWQLTYTDAGYRSSIVTRTIGDATWQCTIDSESEVRHDRGISAARAFHAVGNSLLVAFAPPDGDESTYLGIGDTRLRIENGEGRPESVEDYAHRYSHSEVIEQESLPDGFSVVLTAWNGGIEANGLMYMGMVRRTNGGHPIQCVGNDPSSMEKARAAVAACKTIRAR